MSHDTHDDMDTPINRKSESQSKCKSQTLHLIATIISLHRLPADSGFSVDRVPTPTIDRLTSILNHASTILPTITVTPTVDTCRQRAEQAQVYGKLTAHQNAGLQKYLNYVESDYKKWTAALQNELDALEHEKWVTKTEKGVMVVKADMDPGRRKVAAVRIEEALKMIGEYKALVDEITISGEMGLVRATRKLTELEEGGK